MFIKSALRQIQSISLDICQSVCLWEFWLKNVSPKLKKTKNLSFFGRLTSFYDLFLFRFRGGSVWMNQPTVHSGGVRGGSVAVAVAVSVVDTWHYYVLAIFKALALWADAYYKLKCPSVCVSVCPSVCLFTFEVMFKHLFAPTSWSQMSNNFRDSEFLGKSNGKEWSNIWTFLFWNGL